MSQLREAINAIFAEYDKPSTTKTYPGQKTRVRRGIAIDEILALFQAHEQQLLTELLEHEEAVLRFPDEKGDRDYIKVVPVSVIERLRNKTNDGGRDD